MAAEAPCLEPKRRVEYFELAARSYLARCDSTRVPFRWTINPYRGCEFGCKYCYARYTHEFMEMRDPEQFERKIYAKAVRRRCDSAKSCVRCRSGKPIALGTATDPYQPAERRYGVTRKMLEVFASIGGLASGNHHQVRSHCSRLRAVKRGVTAALSESFDDRDHRGCGTRAAAGADGASSGSSSSRRAQFGGRRTSGSGRLRAGDAADQ